MREFMMTRWSNVKHSLVGALGFYSLLRSSLIVCRTFSVS